MTDKLEARQMKALFWTPPSDVELKMLRLASFDRFMRTLVVNPPMYITQLNTSVFEVLHDKPVVYIEQLHPEVVDLIKKDIPYSHALEKSFLARFKRVSVPPTTGMTVAV
ncbi:unnamed protein product [Sphagnum balticum]